jgi:uncharacterized delta-60 repeat protein
VDGRTLWAVKRLATLVGFAVVALSLLSVSSAATPTIAGRLDPVFGAHGKTPKLHWAGFDYSTAYGVAVQRNGKIVAAGNAESCPHDCQASEIAVVRFRKSGRLDPTFGAHGRVRISSGFAIARAITLQRNGKIVLGGSSGDSSRPCDMQQFTLARLKADGSMDPHFGSRGLVKTEFGTSCAVVRATALTLQPDGKIVAAGNIGRAAVARYLPNGALDTGFGNGGFVRFPSGYNVSGLILQPDGKIVIAGSILNSTTGRVTQWSFYLARFNADGSIDSSFGDEGDVITQIGYSSAAGGLVRQPDGKLVVTGTAYDTDRQHYDFALARYNQDGSPDPSFGEGGTVMTAFGNQEDSGWTPTILPSGKIVVGGWASDFSNGDARSAFALVRFQEDGSLDSSFGNGGEAVAKVVGGAELRALVRERNGKFVAAGDNFVLARFLSGKERCVVPSVGGRALWRAKHELRTAYCALGRVTRAHSAEVRDGRVISARPRFGARRPFESKVNLVVSKGKRR